MISIFQMCWSMVLTAVMFVDSTPIIVALGDPIHPYVLASAACPAAALPGNTVDIVDAVAPAVTRPLAVKATTVD